MVQLSWKNIERIAGKVWNQRLASFLLRQYTIPIAIRSPSLLLMGRWLKTSLDCSIQTRLHSVKIRKIQNGLLLYLYFLLILFKKRKFLHLSLSPRSRLEFWESSQNYSPTSPLLQKTPHVEVQKQMTEGKKLSQVTGATSETFTDKTNTNTKICDGKYVLLKLITALK